MEFNPHHRFQHRHLLGKTGTGKSTCLSNLILADMRAGDGIFLIDPHGQDADRLLELVPSTRRRDVILFDPSDSENPAPINLLDGVTPERRAFVASSIVDSFKSVWGYDGLATPVLDQYLYNTTAALLETPGATLLGIYRMLTRQEYRAEVLAHVTDPVVQSFWAREVAAMSPRELRESTRSTLNKIGLLMADPRIRHTFGVARSAWRLEAALEGKIVIARLPQGRLGLQKTRVIGALLLARLHALALAGQGERPTCHVYIDECHQFGTGTLIEMLSGIRKFGVSLTLCHQYLDQLSRPLREAVLGTIGTRIIFRVGLADAAVLDREFPVDNTYPSVSELAPFTARISTPDRLFRETTLPPVPNGGSAETALAIRRYNRRHHTRSRRKIEVEIDRVLGNDDRPSSA